MDNDKDLQRRLIRIQTEAFKRSGGKVLVIPNGAITQTDTPRPLNRKTRPYSKARTND